MGGRALLRRLWPPALVLLLIGVAWLVAGGPGVRLRQLPAAKPTCLLFCRLPGTGRPQDPANLPSLGPAHRSTGTNVLGAVILVVAGLLVLTVVVAVVLYLMLTAREALPFLRRRTPKDAPVPAPDAPTAQQLRAAVEVGLSDLSDGTDPRRAVIACWLRLEALAERAGAARQPADTPSDLVTRMLDEQLLGTGAGRRAVEELAAVYRLARYAPHPVGEDARDTARAALERLRTELLHPAAGGA
jgi:hypothetical protein